MRVLWFCYPPLSERDTGRSGTWLRAMADGLQGRSQIDLGVVSIGEGREFVRRDCGPIRQWLVPATKMQAGGLPAASIVEQICTICGDYVPEIMHVWGTEYYFGLLVARRLLRYPAVLNVQGLKGSIAPHFAGGLTLPEQAKCIGLREILCRTTIPQMKRRFLQWGEYEREVIRGFEHVIHHTGWDGAQIRAIFPNAKLHRTDLPLRRAFYAGESWNPTDSPIILVVLAYPAPFKGLHVAIRALAVLRRWVGGARLRIAGPTPGAGLRHDGYLRWVLRLIESLGLGDCVDWLGSLDAEQLAAEMRSARAGVVPTLAENACTSMQEAMRQGLPMVASYVGGLSSLATDEESCLFFPPGDATMCASQLDRILTDAALAKRISVNAREVAETRNDLCRITTEQVRIYQEVISAWPPQS